MTDVLVLAGATLVALVYLLAPGLTVLWGLGVHGALRVVAAPAVSLGVWAGATWIAIGLHLPWRAWLALPLLVGLGVDELSVSARSIALVKAGVRELQLVAARGLAHKALGLASAAEVRALVEAEVQ